jgi:hypothetical protein
MVPRHNLWLPRIVALVCLAVLIVSPTVGFSIIGVWCTYVMLAGCYYQAYLARSLERGLGFRHGKQYLRVGRWLHCGVAINWVAANGAFRAAGFREGDVVPGIGFNDFFRLLHSHRGRVVEVTVVDGGEGPPFEQRPQRVLRVAVPSVVECPPTRQDAVTAFSVSWPFALGAIGFAAGCLAFEWPAIGNSPVLQLATPFVAGGIGMLVGFLLCHTSSAGDHHGDVLMPNRGWAPRRVP